MSNLHLSFVDNDFDVLKNTFYVRSDDARNNPSICSMLSPFYTEEDYETSSEKIDPTKRSDTEIHGAPKDPLCRYPKEKSTSLSKLATLDRNEFPIKNEFILEPRHELMENGLTQKAIYTCNLISKLESLEKSKSWPILNSERTSSNVSTNFTVDLALASKSSSARKKKMSMIVERMASLISLYPSTTNFRDRQYEARKLESRTVLPLLCVRLWTYGHFTVDELSTVSFPFALKFEEKNK